MPKLKRRGFLQAIGATALMPVAPSYSGTAGVGARASAAHAQMLWASLSARAGSPRNLVQLAGQLGIPAQAAVGVGAKLGHSTVARAVLYRNSSRLGGSPRGSGAFDGSDPIERIRHWLSNDTEEPQPKSPENKPLQDPDTPNET